MPVSHSVAECRQAGAVHRKARVTTSLENQASPFRAFPSRPYLEKYYAYVGTENAAMLGAVVDGARRLEPPLGRILEVGGGPSVAPLLALTAACRRAPAEVVFADISEGNLAEVREWLDDSTRSFDYGPVLAWLERETGVAGVDIVDMLRGARWELAELDWRASPPRGWRERFDTVSSHFFAESATPHESEFARLTGHMAAVCAPAAAVFLSFMRRSTGYEIGGRRFPALSVDETTLPRLLREGGLPLVAQVVASTPAEQPPTRSGYDGMVFISGRAPA